MANQLQQQLKAGLRAYRERIHVIQKPTIPFGEWLESNYVLPSGAPYSFKDHEYLREMADEIDRIIAGEYPVRKLRIMKSAQCGISEFVQGLMFYLNIQSELAVGYYMPTAKEMDDFVKTRIDMVIALSPTIRKCVGKTNIESLDDSGDAVDNVRTKMVNGVANYYRGAQTYPRSVKHDIVIKDENERIDPVVSDQIDRRLGHSLFQMEVTLSTPRLPEAGMHKNYLEGSQARWIATCENCGHENEPNDDENLTKEHKTGEAYTVCAKCGSRLDTTKGYYKHRFPDNPIRSFHINKLMCGRTNLAQEYETFEKAVNDQIPPKQIMEYYNSDRGEPYEPEGQKLSASLLRACALDTGYYNEDNPRGGFLGIDPGGKINVMHWIPGRGADDRPRLYRREFASGEDLMNYMDAAMFDIAVVDALPEIDMVRRMQERFPGRVYRNTYTDTVGRDVVVDSASEREGFPIVRSNRTALMDRINFNFRKQLYKMPENAETVDGGAWFRQLCTPIRTTERATVGRQTDHHYRSGSMKVNWIDDGKADHDYHATVYAHIAAEIGGRGEIFFDMGQNVTSEQLKEATASNMPKEAIMSATATMPESWEPRTTDEEIRTMTLPTRYLAYIKANHNDTITPPYPAMQNALKAKKSEIEWAMEYIASGEYERNRTVIETYLRETNMGQVPDEDKSVAAKKAVDQIEKRNILFPNTGNDNPFQD